MKSSPPQTELTTRRHISHLTAWYMMFQGATTGAAARIG